LLSASAAFGDTIIDPTGDTFGAGPVRPDITMVTGNLVGGGVQFTVTYAGAISPASSFAANSVVGYIDLDTDQNAATGGTAPFGGPVAGGNSWINYLIGQGSVPGPTINLGDEFYVDLFSESFHPGLVDVVDTNTGSPTGSVPISYSSNSFSLTVPLSLLGGDDGNLNYGVVTGTFNEPTDRAPNGATPGTVSAQAATVPEPGSLTLAGLGLTGFLAYRWRRRKQSS
jgi:hypothetical protein